MSQLFRERGTTREFDQVAERMRQALEQTFAAGDLTPLLAEATAWVPPVDIEEEDDAFVIEAELPGVKRDDIEIDLVGNELAITGEVKERERKGLIRRRTRRVGRFELRVTLPGEVDSEQVEADISHGVLTVRVPKAEKAARRRIPVTGGGA